MLLWWGQEWEWLSEVSCCTERTHLVWNFEIQVILKAGCAITSSPNSVFAHLGTIDASLGNPPRVLACPSDPRTQTINISCRRKLPRLFKSWQLEVTTDRFMKSQGWVTSLLKRLAWIYYTIPNTKGRKALRLIKEPRQKSHLILLAFPFPLTQLVCRCRAAWQKLWTFGKGSH